MYYGHLSHNSDKVHILCSDYDKPYQYLLKNDNCLEKLKHEEWERDNQWDTKFPQYNFEPEKDIETIGLSKNPFTKYFIYPRMFILNPDGDGVELLT